MIWILIGMVCAIHALFVKNQQNMFVLFVVTIGWPVYILFLMLDKYYGVEK